MTHAVVVPGGRALGAKRARRGSHRAGGARRRERSIRIEAWERAVELYPSELWQRTAEPYPGAIVLEDLVREPADAAAAQRILARFAAVRLVLIAVDGGLAKREIAEERTLAQTYVDALPPGDAERDVLARMMLAAATGHRREIAIQAIEAGDHAARHGHDAGAYWLHRTAYALSHAARWRPESLRAAGAIAAAARAGGAPNAARAWRRRARAAAHALARALHRHPEPNE